MSTSCSGELKTDKLDHVTRIVLKIKTLCDVLCIDNESRKVLINVKDFRSRKVRVNVLFLVFRCMINPIHSGDGYVHRFFLW